MVFLKTMESVNLFDTPDICIGVLRIFLSPYFTCSATRSASALRVAKNCNMLETRVWGALRAPFFAREKLTFGAYKMQLTEETYHHRQKCHALTTLTDISPLGC